MPDWTWLEVSWAGNTNRTWLTVVLLLSLGWLGGRLARFVFLRVLLRLAQRTPTNADEKIVERVARPMQVLVVLWMAHISLQILTMSAELQAGLDVAVMGVFAVTVGLIVFRVLDVLFEEVIEPWAVRQTPPIHPQVVHLLQVVLKVVGATVATLSVLRMVGFDVWSVLTGLGIGGVAVALAAQQTLGNVFGSLQVLTDRPYRVGDWVRIDQFLGRVVQIGLRSTRLVNSAGLALIVPNKHMAEASIENHVADGLQVRDMTFAIALSTSSAQVGLLLAVMRELALAHPLVADAPILTQLSGFTELGLQIRWVYHVRDPMVFGGVNSELHQQLLQRMEALGVQLAAPIRVLRSDPAVPLAVQTGAAGAACTPAGPS